MKIGLSYDVKQTAPQAAGLPDDAFEEYDSVETIDALAAAIGSLGHEVIRLGGGVSFLRNVLACRPDLVFNIAEGLGNYRSRESQVPAVLEMLDIPYSGSDPLTLALCLEKPLAKQLVAAAGVAVPRGIVVGDVAELDSPEWKEFPFPVFVKPAHEGSSKGIRNASRIDNPQRLRELLSAHLTLYRQPMLVEEYIAGDEVTVGLIGNNPPRITGIMRVLPQKPAQDFVYSLEVKRNWREEVRYEVPARLGDSILQRIEAACLAAWSVLGIRDLARMDFRVACDGTPYFLEVNPLPGLNPQSGDYVIMEQAIGHPYDKLIADILTAAIRRCGLES
ncbi:MAG: D-alanine--D-alanine ligase [Dehalococcoidia bacterium]|nr:D-alanine--D-alanine ligase [Dehalococcoidia bacterium]